MDRIKESKAEETVFRLQPGERIEVQALLNEGDAQSERLVKIWLEHDTEVEGLELLRIDVTQPAEVHFHRQADGGFDEQWASEAGLTVFVPELDYTIRTR